jgi:hypothetical protein
MMRRFTMGISLLFLQTFLIFEGVNYVGQFGNALCLLITSLFLPICFFRQEKHSLALPNTNNEYKGQHALFFALLAGAFVCCSFEEVRKLFLAFPHPEERSDVLPQIEVQFDRFLRGEFPYKPLEDISYHPFPVYMPLHWFPMGLAKMFHMDMRWSAFWLYVPASMVFGYAIGKQSLATTYKAILCFFPSLPLWSYLLFGDADLIITPEILIAGYYLMLASGLFLRNKTIILIGFIFCLLSRYTLVFWMPLFSILFLFSEGWGRTIRFFTVLMFAITVLYVLPFFSKDPSIFLTGIRYHNGCAVGEWQDGFYTATQGINFAPIIKKLAHNDCVKGVAWNRYLQAFMLLLTLGISLLHWRKVYQKINGYDFALAYLSIFLWVFYLFCPLTYRYYLVVLLTVNIVLLARYIIPSRSPKAADAILE